VEEIKRWIAERRLGPGDKLPKEDELQALFGVSKGTAREALKSLEVQGLVTVSTGPAGGATIGEVPLERAFQLVQNYLFFREMDVAQIYAVRRLLEPELAAGAVPHLTEEHFKALERSIATCSPQPASEAEARAQRQEDLHFHDVLAAANPNTLLRFMCQVINHLLRHSVAMGDQPAHPAYQTLGDTNVAAHMRLLAAARRGDAGRVRKLMAAHIDEAESHVRQLHGAVRRRFVLDSELQARISPQFRSIRKEKAG
jgi:DNA-binding FadR family transcriptional regulator